MSSRRSRRTPGESPGARTTAAMRHRETPVESRPISVGLLPNLLGYNLRRAQITLWRDFNATVRTGSIRPGIFSLMSLIEANPGIAQIDLARQLDMDKAAIVGLIRNLQQRGWIRRRISRLDRRRQDLRLTRSGRRAIAQLRAEMLEHEARFTRLFSRDELSMLIAYLRRIHA